MKILIFALITLTGCTFEKNPYPIRTPAPATTSAPAPASCAWGELMLNGRNTFDTDRSEYQCEATRESERMEHDLAFFDDGSGYSSLHPGVFRRTSYRLEPGCVLTLTFDSIEEIELSQPFIDVNGRLVSFYQRDLRTQSLTYFQCFYYLTVRN